MTGDAVASTLMEYAALLAGQGRTAALIVPANDPQGGRHELDLLIGPASQIIAEPLYTDEPEWEAPDFVSAVRDRIHQLEHPRWNGETNLDWDE